MFRRIRQVAAPGRSLIYTIALFILRFRRVGLVMLAVSQLLAAR